MRINSSTSFLILSLFSFSLFAQQDSLASKKHFFYFNQIIAGGLFGKKESGNSLSVSTVHGIRFTKVTFGAGVGYDAYLEWQTLPIFASLSYDLVSTEQNALFFQLNAGYTKAWNPGSANDFYSYTDEEGKFINPMIGYRIGAGKWSLYILAGYKFQRINYNQKNRWWPDNWYKLSVQQDIERVAIQIGIGLH